MWSVGEREEQGVEEVAEDVALWLLLQTNFVCLMRHAAPNVNRCECVLECECECGACECQIDFA